MKKLLACLFAVTCMVMASCTSDKSADAGELLATVPSDASLVATVNIAQILDKTGCKVDGSDIIPSKELEEMLTKQGHSKDDSIAVAFLHGQTGIDPTVAVVFQLGYNIYVTGVAADPQAFKAAIEKYGDCTFSDIDGIQTGGNAALSANQFWLKLDGGNIDAGEIKRFKALAKSQSFLSNEYSEKLSTIESDLSGWGNIAGLFNTAGLDFETRAGVQVGLQMAFDDASAMAFSVNTGKKDFTAETSVLNSKGHPAKFLLPMDAVDVKQISSIGGKAQYLGAVGISGKMLDKLRKDTESKSPSVFGLFLQQISGVDGTVAVAWSNGALKGNVLTNGDNITTLTDMLKSYGLSSSKNGNLVDFQTETPLSGSLDVATAADALKGAVAGFTTAEMGEFTGKPSDGSVMTLTLNPNGNSLKLKLKVTTEGKGKSFILDMLTK